MDQIVGREGELAALAELVSAAAVGSPRFLVVEGPLGIGKSALLSAAAVIAERAGARVLRAWGNAEERDLAFGVAGQLFELALDGEPQQERRVWLRGPAAAAPMILSLGARPGGPAGKPDPQAASRAVYWLTANIARRTPLVVVVDDLQWADPDSLRWLLHLFPAAATAAAGRGWRALPGRAGVHQRAGGATAVRRGPDAAARPGRRIGGQAAH
jgi:AAA ATPase domain